jgi:hypothetical protein
MKFVSRSLLIASTKVFLSKANEGRGNHRATTAPIIELISNVPTAIMSRSRGADSIPAEEVPALLPAVGVGVADDVDVMPVLVV